MSGTGHLREAYRTSPYLKAKTGVMMGSIGIAGIDKYIEGDSHWYISFGLGVSFVSSKGHLSHLEVSYTIVPLTLRVPENYRSVLGNDPDLTYLGVKFGFGLPL